jgi:hypothetical protein
MPVISTYSQRPPYVQAWGPQVLFQSGMSSSVDAGSQMQYMYHGFPHHQLSGQQPIMQPLPSRTGPVDLSDQTMEYRRTNNLQRTGSSVGAGPQPTQHLGGKILPPNSFSENDNRGESGGSTYMSHNEGSGSGHSNRSGTTPLQAPHPPYFHTGTGVWPSWRGLSVLSPFADPTLNMGGLGSTTPPGYNNLHNSSGKTISNLGENEVTTQDGSKKTIQRRVQRERKNAFKAKSENWPMTIQCTESGDIPKEVRTFVHSQFRANARRFLKLSVIHFRDHLDSDLKLIKDDLDRRFIFNPPLREDYILFYIENSIRTARYIWRKYWVKTGRGEKHKFCPIRYFPALVKYWRTTEAEEESKRMKEARAAAKKNKQLLLTNGVSSSGDSDDTWDVSGLCRPLSDCCSVVN